jgi:PKHD-type hydroxylase
MLLCIADVLDPETCAEARSRLEEARFIDGKATAGWHARLVKDNRQADPRDRSLDSLRASLKERLLASPLFQLAVRPKALSPLLLSRYEPGMAYGRHVDDALMGGLRSDVSFTLFLAEPDRYAGGELVIETTGGEQAIKLEAGSAVVYPSTTLHRVEPVCEGVRLAAVGWARSYLRHAEQREILFDLETARRQVFERNGKGEAFDLLSKATANLLRLWAED